MQESEAFACRFEVRWADLDGNRHVRNTAFSEYATHTRFRLLATHGFDQAKLESLRFGPVMMREEIRYRREVHFADALVVNVRCAGISVDSSHWRVQQAVLRSDGREAAVLTVQGGWLELDTRKLIAPPVGFDKLMSPACNTNPTVRSPAPMQFSLGRRFAPPHAIRQNAHVVDPSTEVQ